KFPAPANSKATALLFIKPATKRRGRSRLHRLSIGCVEMARFSWNLHSLTQLRRGSRNQRLTGCSSEAAMSDRTGRDVSRPQLPDPKEPQQTAAETGVHPIVIKIAVAAALWFVVTSWLAFAWGPEIDYLLVIVTLFFAIFFTLFLLTASFSVQ